MTGRPPLEGLRVLDLTYGIAGPQCTKLLADFGADVIKVEPPQSGDPARQMAPFQGDDPHPEKSLYFLNLNTNKRSVTIDVRSPTGQRLVRRLTDGAAIVVESFPPGTMDSLGLGYGTLSQHNPGLVFTSITSFGQNGPYRDLKATEIVVYAMGGAMQSTGHADHYPLKLGDNVSLKHAGSVAATATVMALYRAEETGEGDHIDISAYEVAAASQDRRTTQLIGHAYNGDTTPRPSPGRALATGIRPCADGFVNIGGGGVRFPNACKMIGHEELLQMEQFATPLARRQPEASELFDTYYMPWLLERTKQEIVALAQEHHLLAGPINTVEDLLTDENFQQRGVFEEIEHPHAGKAKHVGRPFIMAATPRPPARRAPLLGEHNQEVLCGELGLDETELPVLREQGVI